MIIFFIVNINYVLPSNQHDKGNKIFSFTTTFVSKKNKLLLLKYLINEYSISFEFRLHTPERNKCSERICVGHQRKGGSVKVR
jgi:hypothetical protein